MLPYPVSERSIAGGLMRFCPPTESSDDLAKRRHREAQAKARAAKAIDDAVDAMVKRSIEKHGP